MVFDTSSDAYMGRCLSGCVTMPTKIEAKAIKLTKDSKIKESDSQVIRPGEGIVHADLWAELKKEAGSEKKLMDKMKKTDLREAKK
jgi:hypothetical protein